MIEHDTVSILVENNSKILLIKRKNNPEQSYWAVPGGHVEENEGFSKAAQREANEEVGGVEITSEKSIFTYTHNAAVGKKHNDHVFNGKAIGEIRAASDAEEVKWFSLEEMKDMNITNYTRIIINKMFGDKL